FIAFMGRSASAVWRATGGFGRNGRWRLDASLRGALGDLASGGAHHDATKAVSDRGGSRQACDATASCATHTVASYDFLLRGISCSASFPILFLAGRCMYRHI